MHATAKSIESDVSGELDRLAGLESEGTPTWRASFMATSRPPFQVLQPRAIDASLLERSVDRVTRPPPPLQLVDRRSNPVPDSAAHDIALPSPVAITRQEWSWHARGSNRISSGYPGVRIVGSLRTARRGVLLSSRLVANALRWAPPSSSTRRSALTNFPSCGHRVSP
jgi:hypothetical protein